ncbi:hypothetical protein PTSG_11848 [Salpingoeca rosetta]|uniref:Dienelactone hydrolase domain-containing protein n=1 Tax=Salpingoeca rosetta (strain ATCC 50818 / BSB-021) TaxID=946362 RepID=F2U1G5_SALR5|nr:uncharacterized protein PTSG_11848 [Salpingoeca rosetta]EGD81467.1 hypothetical protein PTSG_11848 [Salpingoeca rosetta]|eukprot:XP_004996671.1 hypothetical protein PTSG_11848 [Salpingoeca rosetta]
MTTKPCCDAGPPVTIKHEDKGKEIKLGELTAYVSGDPASAKAGVILFYDIFGLKHPQVREICDRFAARGYYVVMPDVFRGDPWTLEKFPPKDKTEFQAFLKRSNDAAPGDIETVKAHFKEVGLGDKKHGVLGFCWGGKWVVEACADESFGAGLAAHPAFITLDMVKKVHCPIVFCPAGGDVDCAPFVEHLKKQPWGAKSQEKRFEDMTHGFCAARGDWSDPNVSEAVHQVLGLGLDLFDATLA